MDMESETFEQQTTDTTKRTDMDEKKDDGTIDPRLLEVDMSGHWRTTSPPEPAEILKETRKSLRAERNESDEMEVCSDSDNTVVLVDENEGFGAEIARVSSRHYTLDDTEDMDVNNTRVSGGHYTLDDTGDNTEEMDVNNTRVSGGHFFDGHYVMDDIADNTGSLDPDFLIGHDALDDIALQEVLENDAFNTRGTSFTHIETSGGDFSNDSENLPSNADTPQTFTPPKNNENPAEARQTTVVSTEPVIDLTGEPDPEEEFHNSNGTSIGTEPSKDSEEMSDITEVPTNSVASFNKNNVEIKPFNFLGCPDKVREIILRHVLHDKNDIKPFYNFGALELPAHQATRKNYPTVVAAFAGNPELVDQTTTILYGENIFHLRDAKIALWWLKRIGPTNVSKLRHLYVILDEGVTDHFGTRKETLWRHAFSLLHDRQHLSSLFVCFKGWTKQTTAEDGLTSEDRRVWRPRYALLRMLLQWRGLDHSEVTFGTFVTEDYAGVLAHALTKKPGETNDEIVTFEAELAAPTETKYSFA